MPEVVFPAPGAAYRADLEGRPGPLGPHDDKWLLSATELHLAADMRPADRKEHLFEAIGAAMDVLGDECVEAFARREWAGQRAYFDPLVVLADAMYYDRARQLAALMLDDLQRAVALSPLQLGRVLSRRARIAWSLGATDQAADIYDAIARLGNRARNAELRALSEIGYTTLAQFRGDFPAFRAHAARALRLAEDSGNPAPLRMALHASMISGAGEGRFDDAVLAGWRLYGLSTGHSIWECEALVNLGQLMVESGHPDTARAAFSAAIERAAPARILLPALGGLAVASALAGSEATVEWTVREVWRAERLSAQPYPVAAAHLECALALRSLGRAEDAERHRAAAAELARRYRFHEITFKAEEIESVPPRRPAPFARAAEQVTGQLAAMEPERLPSALAFDAAPV